MDKITCPQCHRSITPRINRFGDVVYPWHKMATIYQASDEYRWRPGINPAAAQINEIDCPMSGQVVEDE